MTRLKLLTIEDLINELDMGKATLKFILHRFSPWLATQVVNDETCYTEQAVTILLKIKKFLDAGMLPEQVEAFLAQDAERLKAPVNEQHPVGNHGIIPVDIASISMFKDMFQVYMQKQDRIALAQEALARVEEKKADAMEKRAAAEEKKADAMTNIALALQEMNQRHGAAPQAMEIAGRAVETMALEESPEIDQSTLDTSFDENEHLFEDRVPMDDQFKDQDHEDIGDIGSSNMDDLSLLVNETALNPDDLDDLSSLIGSVSDPDSDLKNLPEETQSAAPETNNQPSDMDDLSKLIDSDVSSSNSPENDNEDDLDDLFSVVDMDTDVPEDLNEDLDNLSALINEDNSQATADTRSDDNEDSFEAPTDNLTETPSIKPDISPDQDMKKYKAAVMEIIIKLKEQGLTAQQTTDRLNRDDVATLSGKPTWGLKAIEKIYGFIDSAK
ncbi:hypothetical protein [Desulfobacter latus]|uniref:Uncharacterized protein n=1 Tax=Desulfobacter latus TaxID=2292 RepID=A0A850T162_9BACT|nr:hypothetical protein [Desulfobacter latus]NWH04831.1 hypothetical protein [Desulfobacter latus]